MSIDNVVELSPKTPTKPRESTHKGFEIRMDDNHRPSLWRSDDEDGERMVCGGLWVTGQARDNDSNGWCHVIEFVDQDQKTRQWLMPRSLLAGDRAELLRQMYDKGLFIVGSTKARSDLIDYLSTAPARRFTSVNSTGWHDGSFVLPDRVIGNGAYLLLNPPAIEQPSGTLEGWRDQVSRCCIGNSRLVFTVSTALTSPLLKPAGIESGGIHMVGKSSQGKTKSAQVARSVFGTGLQSWRATDNGLEGVAARHSDMGLILDDIGQVDPRLVGEVAYMLANGMGKARSKRDGSDRKVQTWRLITLSTGEITLSEHMAAAGRKAKAGQEIRLINIEADAGKGKGLFELLHGRNSAKQFADELGAAALGHYGHAGPAFIEYVVKHERHCQQAIQDYRKQFNTVAKLSNSADGQVQRVATRFALIAAAGELATDAGITGWPEGEALGASVTCFESWRESWAPEGSREAEQAIEQVRGFLQTHSSRFQHVTGDHIEPINRAGYRNHDEFWVFPGTFKTDVCRGLRPDTVTAALMAQSYLQIDHEGKRQARRRAEGNRQRFYVISQSILGGVDND